MKFQMILAFVVFLQLTATHGRTLSPVQAAAPEIEAGENEVGENSIIEDTVPVAVDDNLNTEDYDPEALLQEILDLLDKIINDLQRDVSLDNDSRVKRNAAVSEMEEVHDDEKKQNEEAESLDDDAENVGESKLMHYKILNEVLGDVLEDGHRYFRNQIKKQIRKYFDDEDGSDDEEGEWPAEFLYESHERGKNVLAEVKGHNIYGNSVGSDKVTNLYVFNYNNQQEDEAQEEEEEEEDDDDDEEDEYDDEYKQKKM